MGGFCAVHLTCIDKYSQYTHGDNAAAKLTEQVIQLDQIRPTRWQGEHAQRWPNCTTAAPHIATTAVPTQITTILRSTLGTNRIGPTSRRPAAAGPGDVLHQHPMTQPALLRAGTVYPISPRLNQEQQRAPVSGQHHQLHGSGECETTRQRHGGERANVLSI